MKRLFRTSKPAVDPLPPPSSASNSHSQAHGQGHPPPPPPPPPASQPLQSPPAHNKRSLVGLMTSDNHHDHKHRQGSVTPFPLDAGRDTPQSQQQQQQQPSQHGGKPGRRVSKRHANTPPSMLEIQQMQGGNNTSTNDGDRSHRRDEWLASQRDSHHDDMPPPPRPGRTIHDGGSSPEGWSLVSPHDAVPSSNGSNTPTVQASNLYLPPGARPPSPVNQIRSSTPTRAGNPLTHSQSSLHTGFTEMDPYSHAPHRAGGRERGYSSASGSMRSDHESSAQSHGHNHSNAHGGAYPTMMPIPKPAQAAVGTRSPLHNSYASTPHVNSPPHISSTPSNNNNNLYAPFGAQAQSPYIPLVAEVQQMKIDNTLEDTAKDGKEKKNRFWGRGWGDKKDKKSRDLLKETPDRLSVDQARPSADWVREAARETRETARTPEPVSLAPSSQGHYSTEEEPPRGRGGLGLEVGQRIVNPSQVDNVTAAIQILCAHPDPAFGSIYEVCDRLNHSTQPEQVGKEAAQALRKQFKHGNESERRSAANLWLIMMRNVHSKGFRTHATSKKFLAALEPILLAPPTKPLVSPSTQRVIVDVLADITYNFGVDKGGEALMELWKKVKLPQDSDFGQPLPADWQAFNPEPAYERSVPAPQPIVPPPRRGGPGYANLPTHNDDIRRLVEDCTAAKESARVLTEALVYTQPSELAHKHIIKEFYRKCFRAHEHLTGQIDWAQAEANQSRERVLTAALLDGQEEVKGTTMEEQALATLFEAHSALAEALKQHDDLERLAIDEQEMREVRERSKKETRLDRSDILLAPSATPGATSSRSPSPAARNRLPIVTSPRGDRPALPVPPPMVPAGIELSRTPSPERMSHLRALPASPRSGSPLSHVKARGPRPLPVPFKTASTQSLNSVPHEGTNPSRSGTGSTNDSAQQPDAGADADADDESGAPPTKPSRKALGKRRAVEDPDNKFDPDDMFSDGAKESSASSEESITADDVYLSKPIKYAYDAYQEKLDAESSARSRSGTNTTSSEHVTKPLAADRIGGSAGHV